MNVTDAMNHTRQSTTTLRESEAWLRQILDNAAAIVYVKDIDGRYLLINQYFERLFELREADVLGKRDEDIFPKQIAEQYRRNDQLVWRLKKPVEFEETSLLADELRTYISIKFPICGPDGRIEAVCGFSTDITKRKRVEDALQNAALALSSAQGDAIFKELARHLAVTLGVDCAFIGVLTSCEAERIRTIAVYDRGQILENLEYCLAGTPCENVIGKQFRCIPTDVQTLYPGDNMLNEGGYDSYAAYPLFDSRDRELGLIAVLDRKPLLDREMIESMLKIFAARTGSELERMRSEEARRLSEASYRAIFEATEDAIFIHDFDTGAIVDVNPKACSAYGYSYEEMQRIDVGELSSGEHPYTREAFLKLIEKAKRDQPVRFEWRRKNKDGSLRWDEVVLKRAVIGGHKRVLAFTRDITERKQAERDRARLEAQLYQAQKMEAIGHLTGGIAHDFNNILSSIMGYVLMAMERLSPLGDPKLTQYLDRANRSAQRARDLIQQMLTFSRGQRGEPRSLFLPPLVKESVKLLGSTLPSSVQIRTRLDAELPNVMLDPVQLEQVLMNLCINARDAMAGCGDIEIGLRLLTSLDAVCTACRQSFKGEFTELFVCDTGPGIAPAIMDRMFEPFFSTKGTGKGSGMGLSTVHGIVHEHGGHILVETAPGRGTTFRVLFKPTQPAAADGQIIQPAARPAQKPGPALAGRVLVVDDDASVGEFMQELLESWGLEVIVKTGSLEAQAVFVNDPQQFDLVVTDQIMPGMTGLVLARRFLNIRPDLPIILYTAYSDSLSEQQARDCGVLALLTKPVDFNELFAAIKNALQHGRKQA